jgi:predicted Zn-dependent protease
LARAAQRTLQQSGDGHGPASSLPECNCPSDNRRVISVAVDSSWEDPPGSGQTNNNIWNAVVGAINNWNNATDVNGNKTMYYFNLEQNNSNPDIKIHKGTPAGGAFADAGSGYPYTITLDPLNATIATTSAQGRVAHELGHEIGIGNASDPSCTNSIRSYAVERICGKKFQ